MREATSALILFGGLIASVGVGLLIRALLPERHRSRETMELVQLAIGMMVTLASVVLGLLTYSVKGNFDTTNSDLATLSSSLIQIDRALREYGPDADPIRHLLRAYTAAAIATTWPDEPAPPGSYYPHDVTPVSPGRLESSELGRLLDRAELETRELTPSNPFQARLASDAIRDAQALITNRWRLIEDSRSTISLPFYFVLVLWLVVIFGCFGFMAPYRNLFVLGTIGLTAMSVSSAMYVILDMDTPIGGFISIGSAPLRDALSHLLA